MEEYIKKLPSHGLLPPEVLIPFSKRISSLSLADLPDEETRLIA
jgi:hypothetical protein